MRSRRSYRGQPLFFVSPAVNTGGMPYQSTKASPPKIMVKNSDGSSVAASVCRACEYFRVSRTEPTARHRALLAIFIVGCAQLVVAEYLICLADLLWCEPRSPTTVLSPRSKRESRGEWTYFLELCVRRFVAGVLVCACVSLVKYDMVRASTAYRDAV
jgi:hypothetical protein